MAEADRLVGKITADQMVKNLEDLPVWTTGNVLRKNGEWLREEKRMRVLLLVEGCVVDVGAYLEDHVSTTKPPRADSSRAVLSSCSAMLFVLYRPLVLHRRLIRAIPPAQGVCLVLIRSPLTDTMRSSSRTPQGRSLAG